MCPIALVGGPLPKSMVSSPPWIPPQNAVFTIATMVLTPVEQQAWRGCKLKGDGHKEAAVEMMDTPGQTSSASAAMLLLACRYVVDVGMCRTSVHAS